ncbi:hypothetical protein SAMN05892877_1059 [Rhizobium subbaraonis]|uniref:Uncharacterized protein n=1 Tax=Rhizobium subbaraonis TaxID=908946 RepID=A0A285U844_9HYPH|nr:hypothetical protein [Rhizobium subbaraonis]SOC38104.1 hypothetical protein SAMN05892877_1059 [Rhizobium subbaraonis]
MTISVEDIKARIDSAQGTSHDPEFYDWKNAKAFADLLGFKLKSWRDEDTGATHYGEPPEDARDVDRLTFDNGAAWRSNPPEKRTHFGFNPIGCTPMHRR